MGEGESMAAVSFFFAAMPLSFVVGFKDQTETVLSTPMFSKELNKYIEKDPMGQKENARKKK